jgi:hypothetical protein
MDERGGKLPKVEDMEGLRQSFTANEPGSVERFEFLWDYLVPAVSDAWSEQKRERHYLMSDKRSKYGKNVDVVSYCEEAFALLAFENYRDFFIAEWKKSKGIICEATATAKFSKKGKSKKGTEFLAWSSQECEDRWQQLIAFVKEDRNFDADNKAEQRMLDYLKGKTEE